MTANLNDKFQKKGVATVTTLAAPGKAIGASSITVGSTTNFPTDTGITIAIRKVDSSGNLIAGTYTEWTAVVASATSLTIATSPVYGSDQPYSAGSTTQVFLPISAYSENLRIDGLLTSFDQDGTLKADAVDNSAVVKDGIVTNAKLLLSSTQYTNSGNAGGTGYTLNLGGIKICYGTTNSQTCNGSAKSIHFNNFFTTVKSITLTASDMTNDINCYMTNASGMVSTAISVYFISPTSTATAKCSWIAIGI